MSTLEIVHKFGHGWYWFMDVGKDYWYPCYICNSGYMLVDGRVYLSEREDEIIFKKAIMP